MAEENEKPNTGVVKRLIKKKGFGFITPDYGSEDLFFRSTSVLSNRFRTLVVGMMVEFAILFDCDSRTQAVDIRLRNVSYFPANFHGESSSSEKGRRGDVFGIGGRWYGWGERTCFHCGVAGHKAKYCNESGGRGDPHGIGGRSKGRGKKTCFNCGKAGHKAKDCKESGGSGSGSGGGGGGSGGGGGGVCHICGEDGHFARKCPKGAL